MQNTFAFITISIDDRTLNQCVQEFKEQKFRGRFLQVTVARENFLEKLKREREEASQTRQKKDESSVNAKEIINTKLPTLSTGNSSSSESSSDKSSDDETPMQQTKPVGKQNGSKKFGSSSGSSDDEDEAENDEDNLILKKKSKIFLENGKVFCVRPYQIFRIPRQFLFNSLKFEINCTDKNRSKCFEWRRNPCH